MKCKIYATDEGFGPLVRQSAIIDELLDLNPGLDITFQTHAHLEAARSILRGVSFRDRFNQITWSKQRNGSPDLAGIQDAYSDYEVRSDALLREEVAEFAYDFVISDFVYEAFPAAHVHGVPAFGVAHFTWDWFFSKLFPVPVSASVFERWHRCTELAEVLYFPPFTPPEILGRYSGKAKQVPLVVRKHPAKEPPALRSGRFNVLVIDSGSQLLREKMREAVSRVRGLPGFQFYVSASLDLVDENITPLPENALFIDHIPHVDLVVARAGFNTISECIAYRTPMLLVGEAMNPEMLENMMNLKNEDLGSFISLEAFEARFDTVLPRFVDREYHAVLHGMRTHEIPTDGARIIAADILDRTLAGGAKPNGRKVFRGIVGLRDVKRTRAEGSERVRYRRTRPVSRSALMGRSRLERP